MSCLYTNQILCGTPAAMPFHESRQLWIDALLQGRKLGVYGGSDGHGNFNRNWHIRMPMWSMGNHEDQIFAQSRTIIRSESSQISDLVQAMKMRRTALSTGPIGDLQINSGGKDYGIGDTLQVSRGSTLEFNVKGISSEEFGSELDVSVYAGNLDTGEESLLLHEECLAEFFEKSQKFAITNIGYLRLEISSEGSRWPGIFLSSPIWIDRS